MPVLDVKKLPPAELAAAEEALRLKARQAFATKPGKISPALDPVATELVPLIRHYFCWSLNDALAGISAVLGFTVGANSLNRIARAHGIPLAGNRNAGRHGSTSRSWGDAGH